MDTVKCLNDAHDERFAAYNGDCVDVVRQLPDNSVDFSVYSPPFVNLFVYSESERDMGNCGDNDGFFKHYRFLIKEKMRVTKAGRLTAVHCTEIPARKFIDGYIGLKDFPGEIIKAHEDEGWIYHSRVTIWRDPVVEMTRTKALGLLYKQLQKDSTKSRMGMADYVLVFKKPGENAEPVAQDAAKFPVSQWQKWASPVWMDIDQTRTLNCRMAKEQNDEKHMCPLQLDVIERCLYMWSNPNDVVLSPFMGIGSEGVSSLKLDRRFIGVELKESYFRQAVKYLNSEVSQGVLL
jgi:DNA modification methylase